MKKEDLFDAVMSKVSECTGICREDILCRKTEECTDARSILVQVLSRYLSDTQIAGMLRITSRGVNYLRNTFSSRTSKWFVRSNYEAVVKQMGSNPLATA